MKKLLTNEWGVVGAIFFVALALRLFAIDYGLPELYLVDEEFFVEPALRVADGAWNPAWFGAPGQTVIYSTAFVLKIAALFGDGTVSEQYASDPTVFQALGRALSAIAGALMAVVAYGIGRHWSRRAAVLSGLLVAGAFFLVDHSHTIRPDILQTLFLLGMVWAWLQVLSEPKRLLWYVLLGVCWGLAFDTKYPALFFAVPLVCVALLAWRQKKMHLKKWLAMLGAALLTTFVAGPFLYLDPINVVLDIVNEARSTHGSHAGLGFFGNLKWYLWDTLPWQLGTAVYALTLAWTCRLGYRLYHKQLKAREWKMLTVVVAAASYLVLVSALSLHWARWIIPVMTLGCIVAAVAMDELGAKLKSRVLIVLVFVVLLAAPTMRLTRTIYGFSQDYTIDVARQWTALNVPAGSHVATEPYAPAMTHVTITELPNMTWHTPKELREKGVTHFILSERVHGTLTQDEIAEDNPLYAGSQVAKAKYAELLGKSEEVFSVYGHHTYTEDELLYANDFSVLRSPTIQLRKGPYVRIFQLTPKKD